MTPRNRNTVAFSTTTRRQVVVELSGGSITSDAGLLLLREADRQIGLLDALNAAILKLLVTRVRQVWPDVRIAVRGDSGFCRGRMMRWCDRHDVRYVLGLARNPVIEREAAEWLARVRTAHELDGQSHRAFGTLSYAAQSWDVGLAPATSRTSRTTRGPIPFWPCGWRAS